MKIFDKLLCWIGLHDFHFSEEWEPSIKAKIVTKVVFMTRCSRCNLIYRDTYTFDPITGETVTKEEVIMKNEPVCQM